MSRAKLFLDLVELAISGFAEEDRPLAVLSGRDALGYPLVFKDFTIPVGIVSTVCQHVFDGRSAGRPSERGLMPEGAESDVKTIWSPFGAL
ncbi:hypothetical protein, partial [Salipiger aestuarii]|uniref:hypothetical protein n=1 Tax=Salipiger aestuarii TaxID=568098 RepID=UPI0037CC7A9D